MDASKQTPVRESLTLLLRRRSVIALCCVVLTLILAFYGIIESVNKANTVWHENGFKSFIYFTMLSNTLAALSAAFVFPFAVEGIRKKRFSIPKWVSLMHYIATTCITVTLVFVLAFISWASPEDAFGGVNFFTHMICPPLILLSFFQMESGRRFTWKDRLLAVVPCFVYLAVYFVEVVIVGEENGGWPDIYRVREYLSPALAIPGFLLLAFGVATVIALVSNALTRKRNKQMYKFWKPDPDPIEVRIEAYGMGRMAAQYGEEADIPIPYDILTALANRYRMDPEELARAFTVGLLLERKNRANGRPGNS